MIGQIQVDFTNPLNTAIFFTGLIATLIVFAMAVIVIVRKLDIKSMGIFKRGHGQSAIESMNEAIKAADELYRKQLRQTTAGMVVQISKIFNEMNVCFIAAVSLSSAIRLPLYESVVNNHFTRELMPENYDTYRKRIIDSMKDEYTVLSSVPHGSDCDKFPLWEEISNALIACIDTWIERIARDIIMNCEQKIGIYKRYKSSFEANKDSARIKSVHECIEKNEWYITALKRRMR